MKKSAQLNLRLSYQAHSHLSDITAITGMTKTAAVEYALAQMWTTLTGDKTMSNQTPHSEHNQRTSLERRLDRLALGDWSDTYDWDDDKLGAYVKELETLAASGELNLETDTGVATLQRIWLKYTAF